MCRCYIVKSPRTSIYREKNKVARNDVAQCTLIAVGWRKPNM